MINNKIIKLSLGLMCMTLLVACTSPTAGTSYAEKAALDAKYAYQNTGASVKGMAAGGAVGAAAGSVTAVGVPMGAAIGAIIGGAIGKYLQSEQTKVEQLQQRGVYFFRLGDQVMIVMPSQATFEGFTPEVRQSAYQNLDLIAALLKGMTKTSIKVAAFSSSAEQTSQDIDFTTKQAKTIETYLWNKGVDARLMYAVGYGAGHPWQYSDVGLAQNDINYRVEITLTDLSDVKAY